MEENAGKAKMVDREVERAVRLLLEGIGEDVTRKVLSKLLRELPECMRKSAAEWMKTQKSICGKTTFTVDNNEMVLEKDITFYSMCEHHMLPFYGKGSCGIYSGWKKWLD